MPQFVDEPMVFNSPATFNVLPRKNIDKFPVGLLTPNVANIDIFTTHNTGAITVQSFEKGSDGQSISIRGDGFTTIEHNAVIKTSTGADKLLEANLIYRFTYLDGVWYEDADGGGSSIPIPLLVEGSASLSYIGYFHNTAADGWGLRVRNDGPLTNYGFKVTDSSDAGYFMVYGKRLVNLGPESSTLEAALLTQNATYLSIEGDATYINAGIVMTSGDHKLTSMLYMTGGDRGMRLSWNYREPYQSGGLQMHSDANYPCIQTSWETDGAVGIHYTKPYVTGAGSWDGSGKTFKLFGGGYQEGVGPYAARGEYTSIVVGNIGRGIEFGIANNSVDDYKMMFRIRGYDTGGGTLRPDPIWMWVDSALRNIKSKDFTALAAGDKVLYYN